MFFRPVHFIALMGLVANANAVVAHLKPETLAAWRDYGTAVEQRRASETGQQARFLALDFLPDRDADRRAVLSGAIVVRSMPEALRDGRAVDVPSALVHHWRGTVLIRNVTVADLMSRIEFADPPAIQEDVVRSAVLSRGPGTERVFLRLQRTKIVTAVFNTEHDVTYQRISATRAASTSTASRIAEVRDVGTAAERELPLGDDRGFLWGLNAYWRYEAVPGGVIAECESITLSRSVPAVFRYLAGPLINGAAEESMRRTLEGLRKRYGK